MKGEYRDDKNHHPSPASFHHQSPPVIIGSHQFQLSNTSEEADSHRAITPTPVNRDGSDGATIEVVKRPRGRPPGSKNKPKPPLVITREPDPSMAPYVLELPGGTDIVDAVARYCRKRNTGLCVLTGSGTVANVSLRQPSGGTVTFHGRFDILSLSATVFPSAAVSPFANGFTLSLAGPQGQIVGGAVANQLMSAGPVYIIAASFNNPLYHKLPSEDDNSGGGSGSGDRSPPPGDSIGMYTSHLPSDVIWAPTPRQPQLHPPPY